MKEVKKIKITDNTYPERLKKIKNPPQELYLIGNEAVLSKSCLAIIGSRDCDEYGKKQTQKFASYLSEKNICIVSGLARGIDSIAHYYAKDRIGKTIAVLPSGFNYIYPPENKALLEKIIKQDGCVVSEWPPDTKISKFRFATRNRIISGLAVGTLIIESRYKSGTNITADYTIKNQRKLFCIPGNITSPLSYGPNKYISEGAFAVTSPVDIIEILKYDGYNI